MEADEDDVNHLATQVEQLVLPERNAVCTFVMVNDGVRDELHRRKDERAGDEHDKTRLDGSVRSERQRPWDTWHGRAAVLSLRQKITLQWIVREHVGEAAARMQKFGMPGTFLELEPHLKGGGQFGGFSGPDGIGVAVRALCSVLDYVGIDYDLRTMADIKAARGF